MAENQKKTVMKKSIFKKILIPLMGLLIIEILILVCSVLGQGILTELNNNEKAIINEKVESRKNYLENEMIGSWMNLNYTAEVINEHAERLLNSGEIDLASLDDGSDEAVPLLSAVSGSLLDMMRSNRVTGTFIILNTDDLSVDKANGQYKDKPGIYLRDSDPQAQPSFRNQDILIERAPISLVQQMGIATDTTWNPRFEFQEKSQPYYDFLYKPYQAAYENPEYTMENCGYWSQAFQLFGMGNECIAYAIPLRLSDGSVYGVLGIDITLEYLQEFLPNDEIDEKGEGTYILSLHQEEGVLSSALVNGSSYVEDAKANQDTGIDISKYYTYSEELNLYNSNTPFSHEKWTLTAAAPLGSIMEFAKKVEYALAAAVAVTILIGLAGSFLISYMLQKPVSALSKEIRTKDPRKRIRLQETGIEEIDQMTSAIEQLSMDVIDAGQKFTKIIEMASVRLAGFQINYKEQILFKTENFFDVFGCPEADATEMGVDEFKQKFREFDSFYLERDELTDSYIYKIPDGKGIRFLRLKYREDEKNCYGLVEDVTQSLLEKKVLQHERDHDPLTNLFNRRAFRREVQELFEERRDELKTAALIMLDLDNLKYINDTYGHDYGDKYIIKAALAFQYYLPSSAITARISGDEFNIFLYGYKNEDAVRAVINTMKMGLDSMVLTLPGDIQQKVQASGGIAWYPKDSESLETLLKYADYAMYMVKNSTKGELLSFDKEHYLSKNSLINNKEALTRMIERRAVKYAFQPIVDARTGEVYAYEALMRPDVEEFKSVLDVLEIAKYEGKLNQIEEMTWFEAMRAFAEHIKAGRIAENTYLFLNSIPNQYLSEQAERTFTNEYREYVGQIVVELTEEERIDKTVWEKKRSGHRALGGMIALDDYGTGYNSEKMLLTVSPDFIKVDIAIVNNIHQNSDKRAIVEYIVNYAHERGKYIIAEGVETEEETQEVIRLGVDYLQGYYVGKPALIPEGVLPEALKIIRKI